MSEPQDINHDLNEVYGKARRILVGASITIPLPPEPGEGVPVIRLTKIVELLAVSFGLAGPKYEVLCDDGETRFVRVRTSFIEGIPVRCDLDVVEPDPPLQSINEFLRRGPEEGAS